MKIKLKGKDEFNAFVAISRVAWTHVRSDESDSLPGWCDLKSMEKLSLKLISISTEQRQFRKSVAVSLNEAQTVLLYRLLPKLPLMQYERLIADSIIEQLEKQFRAARAIAMANWT